MGSLSQYERHAGRTFFLPWGGHSQSTQTEDREGGVFSAGRDLRLLLLDERISCSTKRARLSPK